MTTQLTYNSTATSITQGFLDYDVDFHLAQRVARRLSEVNPLNPAGKESIFLIVSGKMGAGKDTIAPLVMKDLEFKNPSHAFFARPLKVEVSQIMSMMREGIVDQHLSPEIVLNQIVQIMGIEHVDGQIIFDGLWKDVVENGVVDAYVRTESTRFALQHWGTDVRRKQDENYWVKKALNDSASQLDEKGSVFVTDARFPNEIEAALRVGAFAVRLDVSEEVQAQRIFERDGIVISEEAKNHISETALDDFEDFNLRIDTDNLTVEEIVDIIVSNLIQNGGK